MLVSLEWLRDFVDFDLSPQELADALTMRGLEVEELITRSNKGLEKVVVGKIVACRRHPNADKLSLCEVDVGKGQTVWVVCGAPNARENILSPFAPVGSELPCGMIIKEAKIRGEMSYGMLCSEKELRLGDDADGIMELPSDLKPGTPIIDALKLDDVILNIELTPNRPDCLSILGVAREVSAITGSPLRKPSIQFVESDVSAESISSVTIEADDLCNRYSARIVLGVKIAPSPFWLRRRLETAGLRAINNVVDVTNYVLMELGHPLHAFDLNKLSEKRIIVRRAHVDEQITTLDGVTRILNSEMLVIADAQKPVAVAGIMGGADSEVSEDTVDLLLESAYFDPVSISKTSKLLKMHTEASHRFERGTDIEGLITSLNRCAQLIQQLAGGQLCSGIIDAYPRPKERVKVKMRPERVNAILGTNLTPEEMKKFLLSIEFQVDDDLSVTVPSFRPDVTREIDLIEEIARLYGYDNIPVTMPTSQIPYESETEHLNAKKLVYRDKVRNALCACGLTEVINYSFHGPDAFDRLELEPDSIYRNALKLQNPISENQSIIRTTLIPGLLENILYNINHRNKDVMIFEIGRVFHPCGREQPDEPEFIAGAITGRVGVQTWNQLVRDVDFYDIKGAVEAVIEAFGINEYLLNPSSKPPFLTGRCADVLVNDVLIGTFGEIRHTVLDRYQIEQRVFAFEFSFDKLLQHATYDKFQPLPTFPSVYRDIAIVLDYNILSRDVEKAIRDAGGKLVRSVALFDVYRGKQIPANKKSLAYSIEYCSSERTLTDEEVDDIHNMIINKLAEQFGAELRK